MTTIPSEAIEAAIHVMHAAECGDRCEPQTYAAAYTERVTDLLTAALPHIEAAWREQVAADISEATDLRRRQLVLDQMDRDRGEVMGFQLAARIARGGSDE